jgi:leucyl-tRNA synthetase
MPIKSAADKLIREMEMFGPDFENYASIKEAEAAAEEAELSKDSDAPGNAAAVASTSATKSNDPSKAKKGKLAAKSTGLQYQFQIMESIGSSSLSFPFSLPPLSRSHLSLSHTGVPREEIKKFAEPDHWLGYFPPIAQNDLNALGSRIDWRRSFITTPINPYYDSFVRWQMNKLHGLGYISAFLPFLCFRTQGGRKEIDPLFHAQSSASATPSTRRRTASPAWTTTVNPVRVSDLRSTSR